MVRDWAFSNWAEGQGRRIRQLAGAPAHLPLGARSFAARLGLRIIEPTDIQGVSEWARRQLLQVDPYGWSAGTLTRDGSAVIIINPLHSPGRINATLMEEICHYLFDHPPVKISRDRVSGLVRRTYDHDYEDEAYWAGSAALVPRDQLRKAVAAKRTAEEIASQYEVTPDLVKFRIKICRLWQLYRVYAA